MTYDDAFAERVRASIEPEGPIEERRMFGGLAFKVAGHMAVCLSGQGGLMVRVHRDDLPALVEEGPDGTVEAMTMGSRVSRTWVHVLEPALADDDALDSWVARGVAAVRALDA